MVAKFGAIIPQGWVQDLPDASGVEQFSFMQRLALHAEKLGYDSIWVFDHFHTIPKVTHRSCFESWTTLAALASSTRTIRLGHVVTCNSYRNPTLLAKMSATLDVISGGRLEFGIGAGWYDLEYRAYGFPFEIPSVRIGKLDEATRIIRKMWSEDSTSFHGKYYKVDGAINFPKPVQKPYPPILVGGEGEQLLLRVVAELSDRCNFNGPIENYRRKLEILSKHCQSVGRDFTEIEKTILTDVVIKRTPEEVSSFVGRISEAGLLFAKYLGDGKWESITPDRYRSVNIVEHRANVLSN